MSNAITLSESVNLASGTATFRDENGKLYTLDLGPGDVHIDSALANYAAGYAFADTGLIADQVCPAVPVGKRSDKFYTWGKDDVFQLADDISVAPGGTVHEDSPTLSSTSYSCTPYALAAVVPTELSANQDAPLNVEMQAVALVKRKLSLAREKRIATLLLASGSWTGGQVAAAAAKWNGGTGSDPVGDINALVNGSLTPINVLAMSQRTWQDMLGNSAFQKYFAAKSNTPIQMGSTETMSKVFAEMLGVDRIVVGKRKYKSSVSAYGYVWGDNVVGIFTEPGMPANGETIASAKTFRWNGANGGVPDGTVQGGYLVRSYFDPKRGPRGSRVIVVAHDDADVMTSVYAGGLITGCHA